MPEENNKINKGISAITELAGKMSEKTPATNILLFSSIFLIAIIIIIIIIEKATENSVYVVCGFSAFAILIFVTYKLVSRYLSILERRELHHGHNVIYKEMKSSNPEKFASHNE